jgi:hypothetical protein
MAGDKVLQVSQIGLESSAGTKAAANRALLGISLGMAREGGGLTPFRPEGYRAPVLTKPTNREFTNVPVDMVGDYRSLTWVLDSLLHKATASQQGGTIAYSRTYTFDANSVPGTQNTYTLERGDSVLASYATYMMFSGFGVTHTREDAVMTATAFAGKRVDGATLTSTPTEISVQPILGSQGSVFLESTLAALSGATALDRVVELEWHMNAAQKPRFSANSDASFSEPTLLAPEIGGTMKLWKNSTSMAIRAAAQAGARRWLRLKYYGGVIASTYHWTLQITTPIEFTEPGDEADDDDAVAISLGFTSVHDANAGYAAEIVLMNDINGSYAIAT